jgi:hypothetical protein
VYRSLPRIYASSQESIFFIRHVLFCSARFSKHSHLLVLTEHLRKLSKLQNLKSGSASNWFSRWILSAYWVRWESCGLSSSACFSGSHASPKLRDIRFPTVLMSSTRFPSSGQFLPAGGFSGHQHCFTKKSGRD